MKICPKMIRYQFVSQYAFLCIYPNLLLKIRNLAYMVFCFLVRRFWVNNFNNKMAEGEKLKTYS